MKKYILNYAWNGYPKGHVFEITTSKGIVTWLYGRVCFDNKDIELLVLSGALTEIKKCEHDGGTYFYGDKKCVICNESLSEVKKIEPLDTHFAYSTSDLRDKINEIINTKLK